MSHVRRMGERLVLAVAVAVLLNVGAPVRPAAALGYQFNVDTTDDAVDKSVGDHICATLANRCSLRAAIQEANSTDPGAGARHKIVVPAGTYTLTVGTPGEYNAAGGDLNVKYDTLVEGAGASETIIQGSATSVVTGIDRLFDIRAANVDLEITGVTLRRGNTSSSGAAIAALGDNVSLTLSDVVIADNFTSNDGGAIASNGTLVIADSTIKNNESDGPTIEHYAGDVTISRTTISGNGNNAGTIRYAGGGTGLIDRSTISGNQLGGSGTGIAIQLGRSSDDTTTLTLRNSTLHGNEGDGAVIGVRASNTLKIRSSTIAGNTAIGIWPSAATTVKNTIFAANSGGNCDDPLPVSLGHNLDSGTTCGFDQAGDISNGKPKLGSLANNGGPTKTRALGEGSDAIDAGSGCPGVDQRGVNRPKDGDSDGDAVCDIGAYEAPKGTTPAPSPSPTVAPTVAPPTAEPTAEVTAEPTAEPSAEVTAEPTAEPSVETSPAPASEAPASPVPTEPPAPVAGGDVGGPLLIGLLLVVVVLGGVLLFALGRRSGRQGDEPAG